MASGRRTRRAKPARRSARSSRPAASSRRSPAPKRARAAAPKSRSSVSRKTPAGSTRRTPLSPAAPNGKPVPNGIGLAHHHMNYSTHDLAAMRRFFTETLGFTNLHDVPEAGYMTVFITPTSSLGFMPPATSAPDQWQPPGEPNFYFFVSDVDSVFAKLSARGVSFEQPPTDMPWGHRLAVLRDPEGRRVCLAQNLQR